VAFNVRVNAVAPGPIATEMLEQLAGDADAKAALIATVPLGRPGHSRRGGADHHAARL
jgi:NAD(P)-dependent dehydrogenase (short-subunit alcohol dehydrogenase family)